MRSGTKQANFLLPEELIWDMEQTVSKRQQSKMVVNALRRELKRLKLEKALNLSFGSWKENDHPELQEGSSAFVRKIRKSSRMHR